MFRTSPDRIAAMMANLEATARELDLPFGPRTITYNSRLAQELGLWADDQGKGEPFHMATFAAYFAEGLNIAKIPVLLELAKKVGLPEQAAQEVLTSRSYRAQVDQDWADSRFKGINAVPTFIRGKHKLVGAQDYTALVDLVTR